MQVNFNEELPKYGKNVQLVYGGGSCCDYAKAVSTAAHCKEGPWKKYYLDYEDEDADTKIGHIFGEGVFPKFSILNPVFTYSLPNYQMAAGFYDILNHICEQYFPVKMTTLQIT